MHHYLGLVTAGVYAQAADPSGSGILDALLKGGPFAVVLALIIFDKLGTNSERDRLREENRNLREQNQTLNDTIRKEVVPPLTELNRLMGETLQVLSDEDRFPAKPVKRTPTRRS
jgi:hypothetical protein